MANPGRRSSMGSGVPLSVLAAPSRGARVPSWLQQFAIPQFMSQGNQDSLQGDGEICVDFHRRWVHPPTGIGGWASQEVFGDESDEDVHGDLCGIFPSLSFTFESLEYVPSCWI
jgi:hypothetical protein